MYYSASVCDNYVPFWLIKLHTKPQILYGYYAKPLPPLQNYNGKI